MTSTKWFYELQGNIREYIDDRYIESTPQWQTVTKDQVYECFLLWPKNGSKAVERLFLMWRSNNNKHWRVFQEVPDGM